jgi:DNA-binding transcriptional MocR family regulator
VRIDSEGMLPDSLERACREKARAVLLTPRVQSPSGAALTPGRARQLQRVLHNRLDVLVIEDDHASFLARVPYAPVHHRNGRWAHVRSFSKSFNPDLRLAVMTGDDQTMTALLDRLVVTERWVSHLLQALAHALLTDAASRAIVARAAETYDRRRDSMISALSTIGLKPLGSTGYNVWLPLSDEAATVQELAQAGWAVAPGERFRLSSPPGIRITASRVKPPMARRFAAALAHVLSGRHQPTA